jgi:TRAP-type uncharacterized transport system fused permease subunit
VLGAAAFLMIEFLSVPYQTIIIAAAGAGLHALLRRVHAGALRGQALRPARPDRRRDAAPAQSLRERWPTLIPLVLLISILVSGRTPYLAAFTGISSAPSSA